MPTFGRRSRKELATAHSDLQTLFNEVIKVFDCSVICGHRGKKDQDMAFSSGASRRKWPTSKHNKTPSLAVDVIPYPSEYKDEDEFFKLAGVVKATARSLGIQVKWGGDFKAVGKLQAGWDKPHWELF